MTAAYGETWLRLDSAVWQGCATSVGLRPPLIVAVVRYLGVREVDGNVRRLSDDGDELRKGVSWVIEDGCARWDRPHVAEVEYQRER